MDEIKDVAVAAIQASRRQIIIGVAASVAGLAAGAIPTSAAAEETISHSAESIHQERVFKATRKRVYESLTDAKQFDRPSTSVLFWSVLRLDLVHAVVMRMSNITAKQLSAVPCPRCGAVIGMRCLQPSGVFRAGPHLDRRLSAVEAVEINKRHTAAAKARFKYCHQFPPLH